MNKDQDKDRPQNALMDDESDQLTDDQGPETQTEGKRQPQQHQPDYYEEFGAGDETQNRQQGNQGSQENDQSRREGKRQGNAPERNDQRNQ